LNSYLYLQLIAGFVLLVGGADIMVRGAEGVARRFGIPALVVGLTIVAFGTSAPELAISIRAGWSGQGDIAMGNIVGSNILNILLILGMSAAITPLIVDNKIIQRDVPLLIAASVMLIVMSIDGSIGRVDGILLSSLLIGYLMWLFYSSRSSGEDGVKEDADGTKSYSLVVLFGAVILGFVLLVIGANLLVTSATSLARLLGVSELLIGLTIVSIGTSLPEIATSLVAALRGLRDMAVGNIIGSCLFNILAVAGFASVVSPSGLDVVPALLRFDLPIMLAAALACLPIFVTGHLIARWEGLMFLLYYIIYLSYLIVTTHYSEPVQTMYSVMLFFVVPLSNSKGVL